MVIEFHWLSGPSEHVDGLREPILFEMPINYTEGMECAFWDTERKEWSFRGVNVHSDLVLDKRLVCETYHLSLFGAIIEGVLLTLACSNFALFSGEALNNLFLGGWLKHTGAIIFLCVLAGLFSCFLAACEVDHSRAKFMSWHDEYFVVEKAQEPEVHEEVSVSSEEDDEDNNKEKGFAQTASNTAKKLLTKSKQRAAAGVACCVTSPEVREALDDVGSAWFEYWAEVRAFCESLCEGNEGHTGLTSDNRATQIFHNIVTHMLILSSRRLTASSLGVSGDVVSYLLEDKDVASYLVEERLRLREIELRERQEQGWRHAPSHRQQEDWRKSCTQLDAWENLRREICDRLHQQVHRRHHGYCAVVNNITATFRGMNPAGELFSIDIFQSCKDKVLALACDLLGACAFSCAFYEASGMVRGKPRAGEVECEVGDSIGRRFGRFLVIAFSCLVCANLPVVILTSLQTKRLVAVEGGYGSEAWERQLRVWRIQGKMYWAFGLLYAGCCTLYILVFLANIGDADDSDWSIMALLAFFQDFVVLPIAVALVLSLLMKVLLHVERSVHGIDEQRLTRTVTDRLHDTSNMMLPIEMV